ncbi:MAG: TonB-dependent receptor [Gemmatimonadetes bacterium]|nr:TonB-dependent receptor [Gemmatimonadota bacterium]
MLTRWRGTLLAMAGALAAPVAAGAQRPAPPARAATDSAQVADSLAPRRLDATTITVTRTPSAVTRAPWAIGVVDKASLAGALATLGIDEALPAIPGVFVANRYNYALDQRLSIRGAGARANFGLRGVKVLLDGIPQSSPDGQSQLTNVDLGDVSRVEVLRGSASTLYGNGSGGVIAFTSDLSSPEPFTPTARVTAGAFGMRKEQLRTAGRAGDWVGALSLSRTTTDGFRQYSGAELRQAMAGADWSASDATTVQFRASAAATPFAQNPGALTFAEYAANRDSAAATNIARGASRTVSQTQFSVRAAHVERTFDWSVAAYLQRRLVDNPLATPPPGTGGARVGTLSGLGRWIEGLRLDAAWTPCGCSDGPRLSAGLDAQRSDDRRRNWRATGGHPSVPTDTLLLDQRELVGSLGPFALATWSPVPAVTLSAGARWDQITFDVHDHFLADGADNSGSRTMSAASGHAGATWALHDAFAPYVNVSTAFETPTTTELNSRPDGLGGFNQDLGPQTVHTVEVGARGRFGDAVTYTLSLFRAQATGAIVQYLETNGRAWFRNAGETRNDGLELGVEARLAPWLAATAAWTESDYRFVRYRVPNAAKTDTLDGKREAGVPGRFVRLGLRARWGAWTLDADHSTAASLFADDRNTQPVDGWGRGVLDVRAAWSGEFARLQFHPFVAVDNLLDTPYVASVTLNGAQGRVLEPAPLRNWYLGMDVGWHVAK